MPTYNRLRLDPSTGKVSSRILEESVSSFFRQDYPNKHLLILADTPGQVLNVDLDGLPQDLCTVVNFSERLGSLGEKLNWAINQLEDDTYLTRWDDDDISLPNRLSLARDRIGDKELLIVQGWFYEPEPDTLIPEIGTFGFTSDLVKASVAKRALYATTRNCNEDQLFRAGLRAEVGPEHQVFQPTIDELHYIYRWSGTGQTHFSHVSGDTAFAQFEAREIIPGEFVIKPRWHRDYVAYADEAREKWKLSQLKQTDAAGT